MDGSRIGSYTVMSLIGEGGMGRVYRGLDTMVSRDVAIKALHPALAADPELVERFRAEATTMAKLQHPNICQLYALLQETGQFYMIMEFVDGETLEARLKRYGRQELKPALHLACEILTGFKYAHSRGVIHRDIKPANIMITTDGSVKIMDFGIARVMGTSRMTLTGRLVGTPSYMSPEQITNAAIDARSDIYSLGIVLFQMLTGEVPFRRTSDFAVLQAQVLDQPPSPREIVGNVPPAVEAILVKALAKAPADRFQSAAEFLEAIQSAVAGTSAVGPQTRVPGRPPAVAAAVTTAPANPAEAAPSVAAPLFAASGPTRSQGVSKYIVMVVALVLIAVAWFGFAAYQSSQEKARLEQQRIEQKRREQAEAAEREKAAARDKAAAEERAAEEKKQREEAATRKAEAARQAEAEREAIRKKLRSQ
jgi:eukaryotic-like serine/threonine-protein kinase